MAKRVQLVLSENVSKLGKTGDLVEVAPGFARNYLLPRGLGYPVTPGVLKQVEIRREAERQRLAELKKAAEDVKAALAKVGTFTVQKQVGEEDAIFGTVTSSEVAEAIQAATGQAIDRRDIHVPDINKLGEYRVDIKLHSDVSVTVNLSVAAQ
jgi:large subunit ribosomal protein L9